MYHPTNTMYVPSNPCHTIPCMYHPILATPYHVCTIQSLPHHTMYVPSNPCHTIPCMYHPILATHHTMDVPSNPCHTIPCMYPPILATPYHVCTLQSLPTIQ